MNPWDLLRETWREWRDDRAQLHAAALSFYALFSLAPLLVVAGTVLRRLFGEAAEDRLAIELGWLLTPGVARALEVVVANTVDGAGGLATGLVGLAFSVWTGLRGFLQLQATLNTLWGVTAVRGPGMLEIVRRKLVALASGVLCGTLLLLSLSATMVLHALLDGTPFAQRWPLYWTRASEEIGSYFLMLLLLTVVYKTLPDAVIRWRDVLVGAGFSAFLFVLGKHAVALWLRHSHPESSVGVFSAIVALLVYVNYIARVLLFGVEFTFVLARASGRAIEPAEGAARVVRTVVRD